MQQVADDLRLGAAQEGVGGFFQRDGGGQRDPVCLAQPLGCSDALLQSGIAGFAGQREAQVGGGVFVRAIYAGVVGQLREALQRMVQLRGAALEIPAAARAEQHIAAEQCFRGKISDVVVEMAGNLEDGELDLERSQSEAVALAQIISDVRVVRMSPTIHRDVVYFAQLLDAADVIAVAVGAQDDIQLQAVGLQILQHGRCFAGVDHDSILAVVDSPNVIVLQRGDGGNVEHGYNRTGRGDAEL